ncbi:transposase, partial [Acidiphilium sp.]|uniref:transposase n=1 Tax=Acidiphilium sp. TaxID=527 RepID=UPI003D009870
MATDLSKPDLLVIQIDDIHLADDLTMLAAVGIDGEGTKHPIGVVEGATKHATVVQALLDSQLVRVRDQHATRLLIIDGAKALTKAIRKTLDHTTLIRRCQVHYPDVGKRSMRGRPVEFKWEFARFD